MPLGDLDQKCVVLDSLFGAGKAAGMASSHTLHLYTGDPYNGGTETDYAGYSAQTVANDSGWPDADPDTATKSRDVSFPDATDAATDDITAWVLMDSTAIVWWEFLDEAITIGDAGALDPVTVTLYVPDAANVLS